MGRIADLLAQRRRSKIVDLDGIQVEVREMSGLLVMAMRDMVEDGPDGKPMLNFQDEYNRIRILNLIVDLCFDPESKEQVFSDRKQVEQLSASSILALLNAVMEVSSPGGDDLKAPSTPEIGASSSI